MEPVGSVQGDNLYCALCEQAVPYCPEGHAIDAHCCKYHPNQPFLYFATMMPSEETPKSRGSVRSQPNYADPSLLCTSTTPLVTREQPRSSSFTFAVPPRSVLKADERRRSAPARVFSPGRPVRTTSRKDERQASTSKLRGEYFQDALHEASRKEVKQSSHESELHVLSSTSDITCPECLSSGPFVGAARNRGSCLCLFSCLAPFWPLMACCLPRPSWQARVCCSRCGHQLLSFDPEQQWLIAR